jgi:LysR family transcriptional regulator, glycine cleavage system transcriptional activator
MVTHLPSLNALRAFELSARHQSFVRAAEELGVTQSAVSHHVKMLERQLGIALFRRHAQGVSLTEAGWFYFPLIGRAFEGLSNATQELRRRESSGTLTLSVSPNFAAKWLVHRLGRFAAEQPSIDLRVQATLAHVDFTREDVDVAVRHGDGDWPDLRVEKLVVEDFFPACSPRFLNGPQALRTPRDLERFPILHHGRPEDWTRWLAAAGVPRLDVTRGTEFNQASVAIDAAVDGQGIVMARSALAAWDLLAGRLVRPFDITLPCSYAYWIVSPQSLADRPKIAAFRRWLRKEAKSDQERLAILFHKACAKS